MRVERFLGITAVLIATPVAIAAWGFGVGTPQSPGAGFWPLSVAAVMWALGALLVLRPEPDAAVEAGAGESRWGRFAISLSTLVLYVALLETLGYLTTTALMLLAQLRFVERRSWRSSLTIAALAALGSLVLFKVLLKVSLPPGVIPLPFGW